MHSLCYKIFDILILARTRDDKIAERLQAYFHFHIEPDLTRLPDYCVYIPYLPSELGFRVLVRDRPKAMENALNHVLYCTPGSGWQPWRYAGPPLIPYSLPLLRTRIAGYHGAAIQAPISQGGCIVLGDKGAGKSTTALNLCRNYGWRILSDENAIIDIASGRLRMLMRPPHIYSKNGDRSELALNKAKWLLVADYVTPQIVVELAKSSERGVRIEQLDSSAAAIDAIFRHNLSICDAGPAAEATLRFVNGCKVIRIHHGGYADLGTVAETISHLFGQEETSWQAAATQ